MNMSANILREIVSRVVNVNPGSVVLSGELPKTFDVIAGSHKRKLHDDNQKVKAYAFTPEKGLNYIKPERACMARQNADGTWVDEEGYSFRYLAAMAPNALFFVIDDSMEINGYNDKTVNKRTVTLYKFKKYFETVKEADIKRWQAWLEE